MSDPTPETIPDECVRCFLYSKHQPTSTSYILTGKWTPTLLAILAFLLSLLSFLNSLSLHYLSKRCVPSQMSDRARGTLQKRGKECSSQRGHHENTAQRTNWVGLTTAHLNWNDNHRSCPTSSVNTLWWYSLGVLRGLLTVGVEMSVTLFLALGSLTLPLSCLNRPLYEDLCLVVTVTYYAMFVWYHRVACSFLKGNGRGSGEEGRWGGLEGVKRRKTAVAM